MADKINPYFLKKPDKYLLSAPTPLATKPTLRDTVKKIATTPTPPYLLDSPDKSDSRKRSVMRDELNTRAAANIVNSNNPVSALLAPNGWGDAKDTFNDSIDRQGGWGLSEDTRKLLGADDTQRDNSSVGNYLMNVKRPVQNLVANAGDAAFRAYQGLMAGTETAALGLDKGVDNAGLGNSTDKLTGNNHSFQPGHGALALMEAFPDGGLHTGIPAVNPREIAGYYAARRGDISMTPVVDGVSGSVIDHVPSDTVPPKSDGGRQPYVVKPEAVEAPQAAPESPSRSIADLSPAERNKLFADMEKSQEPFLLDENNNLRSETPEERDARYAEIDSRLSADNTSTRSPEAAPELTPASYADNAADKGLGFINSPEAVDYYTKNAPVIAEELDKRANHGPVEKNTETDRQTSLEDTAKGSDEEFTNPVNGAVNEATFRSMEGLKKLMAERGVTPETIVNPDVPKKEWETPAVKTDSVADATKSDPASTPEEADTPEPDYSGIPMDRDHPVVQKFMGMVDNAARVNAKVQKQLYSEARKARISAAIEAGNGLEGRDKFYAQKAALSGELPKADFDPIEEHFSQSELTSLFKAIDTSPSLRFYESINARDGLDKMLRGQLPQMSEIKALDQVFPHEFMNKLLDNRSTMQKWADGAASVLNLPRALKSSVDFSAPFAQAWVLSTRGEFYKAFPTMFKSFRMTAKDFEEAQRELRLNPDLPYAEEGGLSLTGPGHDLAGREEAFMSNIANKIPLVRRSEQAYTGFLNKVRMDTFSNVLNKFREAGLDDTDPELLEGLGSWINHATGRGSLGKKFDQAAPLLGAGLFSPRFQASRIQLLNPIYYASLPRPVRNIAMKQFAATGAAAATLLGLAKYGAGLDVELDPRSSKFGTITVGNGTSYNLLSNFGQYVTLATRTVILGQTKNNKGEIVSLDNPKYGGDSRGTVLGNFVRGKAAPVPAIGMDWLFGKDMGGNPWNTKDEAVNLVAPMSSADAVSTIKANGPVGVAMSVPGFFGIPTNTRSPIGPPPATVRVQGQDVPLNSAAQAQYSKMVQSYYDVNVDRLKKDGSWQKYSMDERAQLTAQIVKDGRKQAKADLFETDAPEEAKPEASPQPVVKPGEPLFDGFPGLPQSVGRTAKGNEKVGGVPNSDHLRGDAVDFTPPPGMSMSQLEAAARKYFSGMYVLNEGDHVHVRIPGLHGPLYGKNGTVK